MRAPIILVIVTIVLDERYPIHHLRMRLRPRYAEKRAIDKVIGCA